MPDTPDTPTESVLDLIGDDLVDKPETDWDKDHGRRDGDTFRMIEEHPNLPVTNDTHGWRWIFGGAAATGLAILIVIFAVNQGSDDSKPADTKAASAPAAVAEELDNATTILELGGISAEAAATVLSEAAKDPSGDFIISTTGDKPGNPAGDVDITHTFTGVFDATEEFLTSDLMECGTTAGASVFCTPEPGAVPTGEPLLFFGMRVDETVPGATPAQSYFFSVNVDADGKDANNVVATAPFGDDYTNMTDTFYQFIFDGENRFFGASTFGDGKFPPAPSAARVAFLQDTFIMIIPASEFTVAPDALKVRFSTYRDRTGKFKSADSAADVTLTPHDIETFEPLPFTVSDNE